VLIQVGTLQLIEKDKTVANKSQHPAIAGEEPRADAVQVTQETSAAHSSTESASAVDSEKVVLPKVDEASEKKDKHDAVPGSWRVREISVEQRERILGYWWE